MRRTRYNPTCGVLPWLRVYGLWAVSLMLTGNLLSQELNPPYPRFGVFTFSGNTEACVDILKDFDIIAYPVGNEMAPLYKAANPDVILLATSSSLVGWQMGNLPEEWFYHDVNGNRFDLWGGAWIMNITSLCPKVDLGDGNGPRDFVDRIIDDIDEKVDLTYYDGVFHDWWWGDPGYNARNQGDLNGNGIVDRTEWGADSVNTLWRKGLLRLHDLEYKMPGMKYVVVQIGAMWDIWPHIHGACFEDWPIYNGPWATWRHYYNDTRTNTKSPKIVLFNASHSYYWRYLRVEPYKNNYRAVRYGLSSCLLTSYFFYVDEGNQIAHHGNVHIYDEFESKGQLGYARTEMVKMAGKPLAATPYADGVWLRFFDNGVSIVNATGVEQTVTASEIAALDPVSGSQYFRFQGGQDPVFNNGEEVTDTNPLVLWGTAMKTNWADPEVMGDGAMLFRTRKTFVTPIVVDNNENNQTSPGSDPVQYTGGWVLDDNGEKYYALYKYRDYGPFQKWGFAWSPPGDGENVAVYTPTIGLAGLYEVFEWHGYRGSAPDAYDIATDAPLRIVHANGDTTLTIDQTTGFGRWNSLGRYAFNAGTSGRVEMSNAANGVVLSDAIRFVYRGTTGTYDNVAPSAPQGVRIIRLD